MGSWYEWKQDGKYKCVTPDENKWGENSQHDR